MPRTPLLPPLQPCSHRWWEGTREVPIYEIPAGDADDYMPLVRALLIRCLDCGILTANVVNGLPVWPDPAECPHDLWRYTKWTDDWREARCELCGVRYTGYLPLALFQAPSPFRRPGSR